MAQLQILYTAMKDAGTTAIQRKDVVRALVKLQVAIKQAKGLYD